MMAKPRVLVLRAPGTNCDIETAYAFEQAGAIAERLHIARLLERPDLLRDFQIFCVPGGFSYGDDVAAGRILALQIRHHLLAAIQEFHERDRLILGICNGFQVLLKAGIVVPPDSDGKPVATLTWNDTARYEDRWVYLRVVSDRCVFLHGIQELQLPVAHAEGKFVVRNVDWLEQLVRQGHVALCYQMPGSGGASTDQDGASQPWRTAVPYPWNPNGSMGNVAGVCDATGRIFGLMPHPERFIDVTHHPRWTRDERYEPPHGLLIFRNAVSYFE